MSHTILTPTAVTREALRILHQKLKFVGSINRQYDESFAKAGAKIGDSLKIRLPNEFTVRTGRAINVQEVSETSVTLQVATQKGVDFSFNSAEWTLSLDDYSERVLDPAMTVLAANIESDALSMYKDVYQEISDVGATATVDFVLQTSEALTKALSPENKRTMLLTTLANRNLVDALKGLFNDPAKLSKNYREGMVASDFLGFDEVYQTTLGKLHLTGTWTDNTYLVNDAGTIAEGVTSVAIDTGTGTIKQGDVFFFTGVNRVHPETKEDTGELQQFVATAAQAANATTIAFSPALYTSSSGGRQNVTAMPANNAALRKWESDRSTAVGNAADYYINMGYQRDAFAIAFADLVMPKGVHMGSREVLDGISMRFVCDYDITNDSYPARFDVLYGYKTIRPQLACRLGLN
jgi:hypothetical protein